MDSKIQSNRLKQKEVILLVDNRKENESAVKAKHVDFRNSAFKQTQVDPSEPRPDLSSLNQEESLIFNLKRKVFELEKRVNKLQSHTAKESNCSKGLESESKKKRRKFSQMARNYKCPHGGCQKVYGSETSLKNHLKLKHSQQKQAK